MLRRQTKFSAAIASIFCFGCISNRDVQTAHKERNNAKVWTLVSFSSLTMLASTAWAQVPTKGNVFFGYSYDRTSIVSNDTANLNGWDSTLEGKFAPWIGLVADIDGHYGNHNFGGTSADVAAHNVLFGPRVSVQIQRFRPFAELLVGVGHISRSNGISDSDTSFVNGVGGGLDYGLHRAGNAPRATRLDQHSFLWQRTEWRAVLDRHRGALLKPSCRDPDDRALPRNMTQ